MEGILPLCLLDGGKAAGADKPGELGRCKRIVTHHGEIDAAQAKDEAKRECNYLLEPNNS